MKSRKKRKLGKLLNEYIIGVILPSTAFNFEFLLRFDGKNIYHFDEELNEKLFHYLQKTLKEHGNISKNYIDRLHR
jgi:hypothetical protein